MDRFLFDLSPNIYYIAEDVDLIRDTFSFFPFFFSFLYSIRTLFNKTSRYHYYHVTDDENEYATIIIGKSLSFTFIRFIRFIYIYYTY